MYGEMKKLLKITGGGLKFIILLIMRSPVNIYMTVMQALFLQYAFHSVEQNNSEQLRVVCIFFGVASFGIFLYNGTIWSIYSPFVVRMESRLRVKLFEKISKFSFQQIESASHGDWLTRMNSDVQMPFSQPIHLPHAVNAILQICVSSIILWCMNSKIFLLVMLFVIPHILINQFLIARVMPKLNKQSLEAAAKNTDELNALITCADIAMLYDGHDYLIKRFEKSSLNLLQVKMKIRKRNALSDAILPMFRISSYLILIIVSSMWIIEGEFTFGDFTAASQYSLGVSLGAMMLINCLISIQASMAGILRINETMSKNY